MDDLNINGEVVPQTLKELETINKLLGGNHVTISGIDSILKRIETIPDPLEIADMGCGGGDMLNLIANWANKKGISVKLTGIDANQNIIDYACENTRKFENIEIINGNVFETNDYPKEYDIIISTLFLHHFNEKESASLLSKWMDKSRLGIVINDLHRHPLAYHSIKILTQIFSKSYMVKNDAPMSVLRSFSKNDLEIILKSAGIENYILKWEWAFRWKLVVYKD